MKQDTRSHDFVEKRKEVSYGKRCKQSDQITKKAIVTVHTLCRHNTQIKASLQSQIETTYDVGIKKHNIYQKNCTRLLH